MTFSDREIFEKIKNGDDAAFSQLFDESYSSLCFFVNKYLSDLDKSRSLVQEFFVDLWINHSNLTVPHSPKSYLFNSVKNKTIDFLRKEKRMGKIVEPDENNESTPFRDLVEEAELNDKINQAIQDLPEKCREIFVLCRFDGLKYAEIARKLDISIKTVEMQMGIALKKLRKNLSDYQMFNLLVFVFSKKS
ncbi:RNA polymerase sigma-70 factor [uncultured Draconibacterium sp.]|uniref:RNA polymerase sigma-70 factor n=1 Tax=uncultured Draconibacterium sp. TaxID=1573823 RepID=UPI002AA7F2C7|nr:RNA polymerase sigma-70 factor [uncultured Draconibacterium sp.]